MDPLHGWHLTKLDPNQPSPHQHVPLPWSPEANPAPCCPTSLKLTEVSHHLQQQTHNSIQPPTINSVNRFGHISNKHTNITICPPQTTNCSMRTEAQRRYTTRKTDGCLCITINQPWRSKQKTYPSTPAASGPLPQPTDGYQQDYQTEIRSLSNLPAVTCFFGRPKQVTTLHLLLQVSKVSMTSNRAGAERKPSLLKLPVSHHRVRQDA